MEKIDLKKYMGAWYVIAAIPTFYEKNSFNPVESYELLADGTIRNYYDSNRGSFQGKRTRLRAKAWVVDFATNKKWTVQFLGFMRFAYEILEVGSDYEYSVVGHPSRKYAWIMARKPFMDQKLLNDLKHRLALRGYDLSKLKLSPQPNLPTDVLEGRFQTS